ncbi:sugar porter family MFS transporter [Brachybacterium kimchii]|uniref:Sugar porter family MFS transporter n=1 Tax=Brachybacterium kimchii TaxID=2942909 RepID=A0ABY4N441_9MICO|nr:sugar porter family MFS transporter [Brachybacterium kimchii]UQN28537.1 sugar porter family MFS transporter [Brachybacterium kimchii]
MHSTPSRSARQIPPWFIYLFGALGAILWGYDTGVVSGVLLYIKNDFPVTATESGLITSSFTIGAIIGAVSSALLVDRLGRRRLLQVAAIVFLVGTLLAATAGSAAVLILGRSVLGLGIGFVSVNIPIYLSELSPAGTRGRVVSLVQFMNAFGILLSYIANFALSASGAWRIMLALAVIPAVLLFVGVFLLPESPRWLVARGRLEEAAAGLARRDDGPDPAHTIAEIQLGLAASHGSWRTLLAPWARRPALIAILLTVLAQFLGINAITYYSPTVLTAIGFSESASLITTIGFGSIAVSATLWALRYADSFSRRRILIGGAAITGSAMLLCAIATWSFGLTSVVTGTVAIICFSVFKAGYASTWAPVSRVVQTEILPISIRGTAMSISEVANFASIFVVTLLFPILLQAGGAGFAFLTFTTVGAIAIALLLIVVPETSGRSLEEIEAQIRRGTADSLPEATQSDGTIAPRHSHAPHS